MIGRQQWGQNSCTKGLPPIPLQATPQPAKHFPGTLQHKMLPFSAVDSVPIKRKQFCMSITFTGRPQDNDYNVESEYFTWLLAKCINVLHTPNKYHEHTWYSLYRLSLLLLHHHPSHVSLYRPVLASYNSLFKGLPSPSSFIWSIIQNFIDSQILNLGISWKYVVIFMPGPIDSWGNSPWYLPHWELGGPRSHCTHCCEDKNLCPCHKIKLEFISWQGLEISVYSKTSNLLCGTPSLPFNGYLGPYPGRRLAGGVNLTTYLHLVLLLRISGAIPPFPTHAFLAWTQFHFSFSTESNPKPLVFKPVI